MTRPPILVDLAPAFAAAADPAATRRHLGRLLDSEEHAGLRASAKDQLILVLPLLACDAAAAWLASRPRLVRWLNRTPFLQDEKPALIFERELRERLVALSPAGDEQAFNRVLRLYRHREMARIALRDLTRRAPLPTVVRELSHLADTLVNAAVQYWDRSLATRYGEPLGGGFCIIAMGKYGAEELNYSSDIDVLFVLDRDEPVARGASRRDQALALARAVIKSLSVTTEHGFAFRVDANLRPYGRGGPLVQTVEEMERYYERAGQTWERAALIKARACAGGTDLGRTLLDRLTPFVFRRTLDLDAVKAVAEMKRQIDVARAQMSRDDVKLGRGGIREVEFFAQAMQLLHGGREPRLRVRATLDALQALLHAGFLPAQDRDALSDAYVFLRDVEHRVQIPNDRQTHELPDAANEPARLALARRMGFTSIEEFETALGRHRDAVASRFAQLFAAATEATPVSIEAEIALASRESETIRLKALSRLGFQDPERALDELHRLLRQPEGPFGARGIEHHPGLAGRLLDEMARSPDPDLALAHTARLLSSLWDPAAVTSVFADNPATVRLLMLLFASSEALTREFQLHPDLLEVVVRTHRQKAQRTPQDLAEDFTTRSGSADSVEAALTLLRQLRSEEALRIGLHDLAGRLTPIEVGYQLTQLAEEVLQRTLALARQEISERYGEPPRAAIAVLGFGSFGGAALNYGSDLDLVFVHDAQGATSGGTRGPVDAGEWAARIAQRLVSHLTMPGVPSLLYNVDTRLRPSGTQGPIVASLESFATYHGVAAGPQGPRSAELWERQALLRARPLAGDTALGERIRREVLEPVMRLPLPPGAATQIREMRLRLDAPENAGNVSPKKSPGGLLDVEFLVQSLQLRSGLRQPSTRRGLVDLMNHGVLPRDLGQELLQAHALFRRIEGRLRLMYGRSEVYVPPSGAGLTRLARQLGEIGPGTSDRFMGELRRTMHRTREIFLLVVQEPVGSHAP